MVSGCGIGVDMSNILEICEFPTSVPLSDMNGIFADLKAAGATMKWSTPETHTCLKDFTPGTQTISPNVRVFAVFADSSTAAQILNTHSSKTYKLRSVDSIADSYV